MMRMLKLKGPVRRAQNSGRRAALSIAIGAAASAACGDADTGRGRTAFDLQIAQAATTFTTSAGYDVQLSEARISIQRVEFFEGDPLFTRRASPWPQLIASAYAHPGHYQEGEALADVLTPLVVDLTGDPTTSAPGNGVTGEYRSARITLAPDPTLDGATVSAAGTATKSGVSTTFSGTLALDEAVTGIAVLQSVDVAQGRFTLTVEVPTWLDRVEFDEVGPSSELEPETQPHNAWIRGVRNTSAYTFHFEEMNE